MLSKNVGMYCMYLHSAAENVVECSFRSNPFPRACETCKYLSVVDKRDFKGVPGWEQKERPQPQEIIVIKKKQFNRFSEIDLV